tara:strand:- start:1044 stop:3998 length:2955 start_codon:yes stop_codon:yes gene_type:complete
MSININDPVTGDSFQYFGSQPLNQSLARELIGASIVEASQELLDGSYKKDALGKDVDDLTAVKRLERNTALQLRVPIQNVDATSGIGDADRMALGLRPTMGQKLDHLRGEYGYRNVQAVPVNGSYRLIIKTEGEGDNAKYKYVNEEGLDFGDITQFGAGAAIPIIAATAAVIAAPVVIPSLAVAGWGSAATLATISAGSYFGAGVLQDSAVALYDGTVPDFGEITKRRGVESAVAFVPEMAFIRGGQWLSGFAGSGADDVAKLYRKDIETLKTTYTKVLDDGTELVPKLDLGYGGLTSRGAAEAESKASANSAALRKMYQTNIDELDVMLNSLKGGSPQPIEEVVELARTRITQQLTQLSDDVASFEPPLRDAIQKILQTKMKRMGGTKSLYLSKQTGEKIQKGLQRSFEVTRNEKRKLFDKVTATASDEGIFYDVDSILKAMRRALDEGGAGIDDVMASRAFATAMERAGLSDEAVLKALKEKLPLEFKGGMKDFKAVKTLSYKQLDTLIKKYAERSDFGVIGAVGETPGFSRLMLKELAAVRDKTLKGTRTQKALTEANEFYKGEYGQFLRVDVKPMIKPDFGSGNGGIVAETHTVMGGENVMKHILTNGTSVEETLKAFPKIAGPGMMSRSQVEGALRTAYMQKLGLNGTVKLGKGMRMNVDNNILRELFGKSWKAKKDALEQINDLVSKSGKVLELDDNIFREILSVGTPTQRKNAQKIANAKVKAAEKITEEQNKLFEAIVKKKGTLSTEDALEAVGSLLNYSSREITDLVKVIKETSPEFGIETLRNKLATEIIESAKPTKVNYATTSRGEGLFDSDIMLTRLKDVKIRKVATEVLGKEWVENMEAIARVAKYSTPQPRKLPGVRPVVSPGSGGMQTTIVIGDLLPDVSRYFFGRFAATPGLKNLLSRKTPDEAALVFRQWLPFFMATDEGMKALMLHMRDHPEMSVYIQEELANLGNLAMEQDQAAVRRGEMNAPAQ